MTTISFAADIYLRPTTISSWPCKFINTSVTNKTVYIMENFDLVMTDDKPNMYFIMGSSNITIDGQNYTFYIELYPTETCFTRYSNSFCIK